MQEATHQFHSGLEILWPLNEFEYDRSTITRSQNALTTILRINLYMPIDRTYLIRVHIDESHSLSDILRKSERK
jgi:hypothetical protein